MADQTSAELSGWIEYERVDTERQVSMVQIAIARAFAQPKKTHVRQIVDDDDEEVIDTTQPDFSEHFQITNTTPAQSARQVPQTTEIRQG